MCFGRLYGDSPESAGVFLKGLHTIEANNLRYLPSLLNQPLIFKVIGSYRACPIRWRK
jgi:hypothetical protein